MKIKRERQVRLDELIKYIFDNDIEDATFYAMNNEDNSVKVHVYIGGFIKTEYLGCPNKNDLFTITEEVEIDEETPINLVYRIKTEKGWQTFDKNETPINRIINTYKRHPHAYLGFIYLQNDDGSIGELIWKDGELVD